MDDYPINTAITSETYIEMTSWSRLDAEKANESWVETDCDQGWIKRNPILLWEIIQNIKHCQKLHNDGDKRSSLHALQLSLSHNLPIPLWVKNAFTNAYNEINQFNAKGWDDVFGQPYPKNTVIKSIQKMRSLSLKIYNRVREIANKEPKTPIDTQLFEQVGKEFYIGKTLAAKYYYHVRKRMPQRKLHKRSTKNTKT